MTGPALETLVCVGAVAGAFGVRGEVRLKSFCADPAAIEEYQPLWTEDARRSFSVQLTRTVKGAFAARLGGVATREAAEALRGTPLHAVRATLPPLPDDEFYHADLIGLSVTDPGGGALGRVRAVYDFGAGDMLEVIGGPKPLVIPFTRAAVPFVDLTMGRIIADPPDDAASPETAEDGGDVR
ncbi:MAG: ribosome maturation factor RimM [Pseudomonadota bacterium]